jgi:hypothetical protein
MGYAMKTKLMLGTAIVSVASLLSAAVASAGVVDLNFEGINSTYPSGFAFINGFYDGGTSSDGTSGPNYGISFSSNAQAICLNSLTVSCSNTSRGGLAPSSAEGGLFFVSGSSTTMDVAGGFTTGFSFNYSDPFTSGGNVQVFSGLDGTGTLLASFNLPLTTGSCPGYGAQYCPFFPVGVAFAGTAQSVLFGGVANQVVFDDVTFGSSSPGVPEPATWAMMLLGVGMIGGGLRIARRKSGMALTAA